MSAGLGVIFLFFGTALALAPLPVFLFRWIARMVMPRFQDTPANNLVASMAPAFAATALTALFSVINEQIIVVAAPILFPLLTGWVAIPFWFLFGIGRGFNAPTDPKALRKYSLTYFLIGLALVGIGMLFFAFGEPIDWK